jgi:V/A-type H+-transporting ATPase subunit I
VIVDMSRIVILGPKRALGEVTEAVQRVGSVQIDRVEAEEVPQVQPISRGGEQESRYRHLEGLEARIKGLLELLPRSAGAAGLPDLAGVSLDEVETKIVTIENEARDLTRRRLEAEEELEIIRAYESAVRVLSPLLAAFANSRHFETYGFTLKNKGLDAINAIHHELNKITNNRVEITSHQLDDHTTGVVIAYLKQDADAVRAFLHRTGLSELRLPARYRDVSAAEAVKTMEQQRARLPREIEAIGASLVEIAKRERPYVQAAQAVVLDELTKLQVLPQFAQSRYTFIMHGWVPSERVTALRGTLARRFGAEVMVYDAPADAHDAAEAERIPVILKNPPWAQPFTLLIGLFRPPRYGGLDPTIWLAIFFPIYIGLVIGDASYGLLFLLLANVFRRAARAGKALTLPVVNIRIPPPTAGSIAWVITVCAFWVIAFGVLYGEFLGDLAVKKFGVRPIFHRVHEPQAFLMLIFGFGVVQIAVGLLMGIYSGIRHRNVVHVAETLALFMGGGALLAGLGAMGGFLPQTFIQNSMWLALAFAILWVTLIVLRASVSTLIMAVLESFSAFGAVLSFARLFALGLAAALLAEVANELGGKTGSLVVGILAGILLQLVFLVLTLIGHTIQPARLNWVEFFTKFKYHDETGTRYRPFQRAGGD